MRVRELLDRRFKYRKKESCRKMSSLPGGRQVLSAKKRTEPSIAIRILEKKLHKLDVSPHSNDLHPANPLHGSKERL